MQRKISQLTKEVRDEGEPPQPQSKKIDYWHLGNKNTKTWFYGSNTAAHSTYTCRSYYPSIISAGE